MIPLRFPLRKSRTQCSSFSRARRNVGRIVRTRRVQRLRGREKFPRIAFANLCRLGAIQFSAWTWIQRGGDCRYR